MAKFVTIGERIHCISPSIKRAMEERDPAPILKRAAEQIAAGATYLDVNIGPAEKDGPERMMWAVKLLQENFNNVPLALDTANKKAIEAGIKVYNRANGKPIVNSADAGSRISYIDLAAANDAICIALCSADGIAKDNDERMMHCRNMLERGMSRGMEAAVFCCPACGVFSSLRSQGDKVYCSCGFSAKYTVFGELEGSDGRLHTVTEWDALQRERLARFVAESADDSPLFSDPLRCEQIDGDHSVVSARNDTLIARKDGVVFGGRFIPLKEIRGLAVHSRNTLTVHIGENETQYELHGEESFSALKYLYLYQMLQGKK